MAQVAAVAGMALAQILGTWGSDKLSDKDRQDLQNAIDQQIRQDNEQIRKQREMDQDTINMLQSKYEQNIQFQKQEQSIQMNAVLTQLQLDQVKLKQAQMEADEAKNLLPGVSAAGLDKNTIILIGAGVVALMVLIR